MATANSTSPRSTKAAKPAAKSSAARRGGTSASARSQSTKAKVTKAKATDRRSASTRSVHQAQSALRQTETATGWPIFDRSVDVFGDYTERAVLIPVGAALIARERVVSTVNDAISSYGSTTKAQAQLRRFERRGNTARNRLEREVRKARVRFERELRQRRRELEKTVSSLEDRRDAVAKNVTELPNRVQERILSLV